MKLPLFLHALRHPDETTNNTNTTTSSTTQKSGKRAAVTQWLSARPFTLAAGPAGTERNIDRALRDSAPLSTVQETPANPLLQRSQQLLRVAQASVISLDEYKTSIWQRPAADKHRQRMVRLFPFLKPRALRDVAAAHGNKSTVTATGEMPLPREKIAETAQQLQQTLAEQRLKLQTATTVLEQQYQARAIARHGSGNQELDTRIRLAEEQVQYHQIALRQHLEDPTVLALTRMSDFADNVEKQGEFTSSRLRELADAARDMGQQSHAALAANDAQFNANTQKIRQLMTIANSMENGYRQLNDAFVALEKLSSRQPPADDEEICRHLLLRQGAESLLLENLSQLEMLEIDSTDTEGAIRQTLMSLHRGQRDLLQQRTENSKISANATRVQTTLADKYVPPPPRGDHSEKAALAKVKQEMQAAVSDLSTSSHHTDLARHLEQLTSRLNNNPLLTKQPPWLIAEIVKHALDERSGAQSAQILQMLSEKPVQHWLSLAAPQDHLTQALFSFCHRLCALPRGADLLQLLSVRGDIPPDGEVSKALHTYWNADAARQQESDPAVSAWLARAQRVAKNKLTGDNSVQDEVSLAAYNAVRNGYLSNAPGSAFDRDNQRLLKVTHEWVFRAMARPPEDMPSGWRLLPNVRKNPFAAKTRDRAMDIADGMGMPSLRTQGETLINTQLAQVKKLAERCRTDATHSDGKTLADSADNLCKILLHARNKSQPLSQQSLGSHYLKALRRMQSPQQVGEELPAVITSLFTQQLSVYEALHKLAESLNHTLPEEQRQTLDSATADEQAALRLLKSRYFSTKEDILTFFKPLIEGSRLRDRVKVGDGGTVGGGLTTLPLNGLFPAVPTFSFELARSDEAWAQLFMPILGMEMSFGKTTTQASEASIGFSAGGEIAPGVTLSAGAKGTLRHQQAESDATLIRFFRRRFHDDEMKKNMYTALDSMVRWDTLVPHHGPTFSGPLEAIFARCEAVSLSHISSSNQSTTARAAVFGRLPFISHATSPITSAWVSNEASLSTQHEHSRDRRQEAQGTTRINGYQASTTTQTQRLDNMFSASPLSNQPVHVGNAITGRYSPSFQTGLGRDLKWHQERNELSLYTIEDRQDADLDRHYSTVADMQKEIAMNRDAWLMRCIETLEPDANQRDTPALREQASGLLDDFEQQLAHLAKQNNYCLFNVNYSLKGETGAEIDAYRSLAHLLHQRGQAGEARKMESAIDTLLQTRESWRPLMLIVRERAKENARLGLRSVVRVQHLRNNDGLRTAMQFPPP